MRRKTLIIGACTVGFAVALFALAMAGPQNGKFARCGYHQDGKGGLHILTRYVMRNMMLQTLSEITREPVATLDQKLQPRNLRALLDEYKVDRAAFHTAMRARVNGLVEQLAEQGYLTPEQKKDVLENMEARAQRRGAMNRPLEK